MQGGEALVTGGNLTVQFNHDAERPVVLPCPKNSHFIAVSFILLPKDHRWPPLASVWPA